VAYLLSGHFQGTPYDPYSHQNTGRRGIYRSIGINRTGVTSICQIRPDRAQKGLEWICFGSTTFGGFLPLYPNVRKMPDYVSRVGTEVSTENWYWGSRLIAALADPNYGTCIQQIGRYREEMAARGRQIVAEYDRKQTNDERTLEEANAKLCEMARELTAETLGKVLADASEHMKNGFNLSDN
jgi:dipeptidase